MFAAILPSDAIALEGAASSAETRLQRSFGSAELVISSSGTVSKAYQNGALKLRFPKLRRGEPAEVVLINLSGGMTGGDRLAFSADISAGASAAIGSQACERIYRSLGMDAEVANSVTVRSGAALDYLPQATILFDGARLKRETRFELAEDARLLAIEAVIFGRLSSAETLRSGALSDACFIRRGGRLIHADRFRLSGDIHALIARENLLSGYAAAATLRYVAPDAADRLAEVRDVLASPIGIAAASAWDGMLVARFIAPDSYRLNRDLNRVAGLLRLSSAPNSWLQ